MATDQPSFYERVYKVVRKIPRGKVTNYGAIAKFLGTAKSSRLVGYAMNNSHTAIPPVPAHRVVNRNGMLSGKNHFFTPTLMQELLENEGLVIKEDKIVNFRAHFWDPAAHLDWNQY